MTGPAGWRRLAVVVAAVLIGAAAAAYGLDWAARGAAQSLVARDIRRSNPHPASADVDILGAFFLPEVVDGRYAHVHVRADRIEAQHLVVSRVDADLYGVRLPVSEVVRQNVTAVEIAHTTEHAFISYAALNSYLRAQGQPITVSRGKGGALRLEAHFDGPGQGLSIAADATVHPGYDYLDVVPTRLDTGSSLLDMASEALLKVRLAVRVTMAPLPFGQRVRSIRPTADGIVVVATGRHVVIFP